MFSFAYVNFVIGVSITSPVISFLFLRCGVLIAGSVLSVTSFLLLTCFVFCRLPVKAFIGYLVDMQLLLGLFGNVSHADLYSVLDPQ